MEQKHRIARAKTLVRVTRYVTCLVLAIHAGGQVGRADILLGSVSPSAIATTTYVGIDERFDTAGPIGDVDNNGLIDLAFIDRSGQTPGKVFVVYTPSTLPSAVQFEDVDGAGGSNSVPGFVVDTSEDTSPALASLEFFGYGATAGGDVNGDGIDDLIVRKPSVTSGIVDPVDPRFNPGNTGGHAYVIYGQSGINRLSGVISSPDIGNTIQGARYYGPGQDWFTGHAATTLGDINGDGADDFAISSNAADIQYAGQTQSPVLCGGVSPCYRKPLTTDDRGAIHIIYGDITPSLPNTANNVYQVGIDHPGLTITASTSVPNGDAFGDSLAAGDFNGDGLQDLLIGAGQSWANGQKTGGKVFFISGATLATTTGRIEMQEPNGTVTSVAQAMFSPFSAPSWADSEIGDSVHALGDINGDGIDDFALNSFLVLGQSDGGASPFTGFVDTDNIAPNGPVYGKKFLFGNILPAGDFNGDGLADFFVEDTLYYGRSNVSQIASGVTVPAGLSFSSVGDIDLDGNSDILLTDRNAGSDGESYLIRGVRNRDGDLNGDNLVNSDDADILHAHLDSRVTPGVWALGDPQNKDGYVGADDWYFVFEFGDVNGDFDIDAADIDTLYDNFASMNGPDIYDLNTDGRINQDDVTHLVVDILGTNYGDANLDGSVGASDYNTWLANVGTSSPSWANADFNGNGTVGSDDYLIWLSQGAPATVLLGDVDGDLDTDADDINLVYTSFGTQNIFPPADLDNDSDVDQDDVSKLVEVYFSTTYGDANLDGIVDDLDFDIWLMNAGTTIQGPEWSLGDFDGDGSIGSADYNILLGGGSPVPEPATLVSGALAVLLNGRWRRRH
jgi:hypothetical protein